MLNFRECSGTKVELNNQTNIAMNGTNCDSEIIKISHSPTTVVEDNSSDVEMESSSNSTNGLSSSASNGVFDLYSPLNPTSCYCVNFPVL